MAAKKDSSILLLLLLAGGALLAMGGKAKAAAPPKREEEDEPPRGIVIPLDDELQRVDTPAAPEGAPLTERPIGDPIVDAARAAAAAADAQRQLKPLYPSVPRPNAAETSIPRAQPGEPHELIPEAQAPLEAVPAPASPLSDVPSSPGPNLPAGYDPDAAKRGARAIAAHLKRAGRANYDRRLLEQWQRQAGIEPDRIYGGASRGALLHFGVKTADAPAPFFKPFETIPYVPPDQR